MFGGEMRKRPAFLSRAHHLDRNAPPGRGGQLLPGTRARLKLCPNTAKAEKMFLGFLEGPYFFNATNLLMEIKDLVMYPKG
jgi:hypothetical protein